MVTPPSKKGKTNKNNNGQSSITSPSPVKSKSFAANVVPFHERKDAGVEVTSYVAEGISTAASSSTTSPAKPGRCVVSTEGFQDSNVTKPYRHMFSSIPERAAALESHLVNLGGEIIEKFGISNGENGIAPLEQVNVPRQDKICCVGRVCNEAHTGKLNKTSVVLEGSGASSGGARINVDLSHLESTTGNSYSIFPGQIVAVEGINLTGRKLVAHRICEGAAQKPQSSTVRELREFHHDRQEGAPLKIATAAGPFTTSDNLDYQPLIDLVSGFLQDELDAVILTGPFVDAKQELIKSGRVLAESVDGAQYVASYEAFFADKIATLLTEFFQGEVATQFILIPSLDDTVAKAVYPQPPLSNNNSSQSGATMGLGAFTKKSQVHCLSNPCTFKINEVVFGATSTDVLFHMSAEEIHHNLPPNTRLRRIAQHVLQQRSYYPVFPPPAHSPTNLDLKHMDQWKLPCRPDVLLLPSKLKAMACGVLDTTVVVNSGPLTRATSGGSYAVLEIHPLKRETLDSSGDDVSIPHNVNERIKVTVKRI